MVLCCRTVDRLVFESSDVKWPLATANIEAVYVSDRMRSELPD